MSQTSGSKGRRCVDYYAAHPDALTTEIADAVGCSRDTVLKALRSIGVKPRGRTVWARKVDPEEVQKLYESGLNKAQIGARLGVTPRTVGAALRGSWSAKATCAECGVSVDVGSLYCQSCQPYARVKMNSEGQLWCAGCQSWKDQDEFPANRAKRARRRHGYCRPCNTRVRRETRRRARERTA